MLTLVLGISLATISVALIYLYKSNCLVKREFDDMQSQFEELIEEKIPVLEENNKALELELKIRRELEEELQRVATVDSLTGLYNRRKFEATLDYEVARNKRYPVGLSLILVDIDYFKNVNDTYGHDVGDKVLQDFAGLLKKSIRKTDIAGRWGGEEFMIILPESSASTACAVAEKIRKNIESAAFDTIGKMTASMGVCLMGGSDEADSLIKRADIALYEAKRNGRNMVQIAA